MHRTKFTLAALLTTLASVFLASSATAFTGHGLVSTFGSFTAASGIAVDKTTGNVFVADSGIGVNVVDVFGPEGGAPVGGAPSQITGAGSPQGAFEFGGETPGIAIDSDPSSPSFGAIYITDVRNRVVDKFKLNGSSEFEYVSQITGLGESVGATVDADGNLYVSDYSTEAVHEYSPTGEVIAAFSIAAFPHPKGIAVDSTGDMYVQNYDAPHNMVKLTRSSDTSTTVESEAEFPSETSEITGIAIDRSTGNVFTDFGSLVIEYNGEGAAVSLFGFGTLNGGEGIAINETTHDSYIANRGAGNVVEFTAVVTLPDVSIEPPTGVTSTEASLSGTVNPSGVAVTETRFEYGTTTAYGSTAPGSPNEVPAEVESAAITGTLAGLAPNTTYHVRLVAANSEGSNHSGDQEFTTQAAKPLVIEPPTVTNIGRTSAVLSGTVNPEHSLTNYHFEYVSAATYNAAAENPYGEGVSTPEISAGEGSENVALGAQVINELRANTEYHYRLVATNQAGVTFGVDHTFTTTTATPPAEVDSGSAIEVGHTNAVILGAVRPQGLPTSLTVELGTSTAYGTQMFAEAGASFEPVLVSFGFLNLAPGTTYHYRLVATNEDGTVAGADKTFTTAAFPNPIAAPEAPRIIPVEPVPIPPILECAKNQVEKNGKCVKAPRPPVKCKKGSVKKHGKCVKKSRKKTKGHGKAKRK